MRRQGSALASNKKGLATIKDFVCIDDYDDNDNDINLINVENLSLSF